MRVVERVVQKPMEINERKEKGKINKKVKFTSFQIIQNFTGAVSKIVCFVTFCMA